MLKQALTKIDDEAQPYALNYLQTKEHHEIDFALVNDQNIELMIEVKLSTLPLAMALKS